LRLHISSLNSEKSAGSGSRTISALFMIFQTHTVSRKTAAAGA
jgi:hypothetical protein